MEGLNPLSTIDALVGKNMVGGGYKKKSASRKAKKMRKAKKQKMYMKMNVPKRYRMGFFGGNQKYLMCTEVNAPSAPSAPAIPPAQSGPAAMIPAAQAGGAKMRLAAYKKMLENLGVDKLQKMAVRKGVKITKKKDGKTVYVKKATLVRKLCECKLGRKLRRKNKSSKRM